ncbi:MAG: hypothetical protein P1P77_13495, partial [Spirochaetaceae bacterium]|nr:hypothetical protein [Spirochaetaceae bacterium]
MSAEGFQVGMVASRIENTRRRAARGGVLLLPQTRGHQQEYKKSLCRTQRGDHGEDMHEPHYTRAYGEVTTILMQARP